MYKKWKSKEESLFRILRIQSFSYRFKSSQADETASSYHQIKRTTNYFLTQLSVSFHSISAASQEWMENEKKTSFSKFYISKQLDLLSFFPLTLKFQTLEF